MGAGIDNAAVEFEEVSLSNLPLPQIKENTEASRIHR
jgi:hypothetical protein